MRRHARKIPDPQTEIAFAQLGEGVTRVPKDATAYTHRDAAFVMNVHGRWDNPANGIQCVAWARELFQAATPVVIANSFREGAIYSHSRGPTTPLAPRAQREGSLF